MHTEIHSSTSNDQRVRTSDTDTDGLRDFIEHVGLEPEEPVQCTSSFKWKSRRPTSFFSTQQKHELLENSQVISYMNLVIIKMS